MNTRANIRPFLSSLKVNKHRIIVPTYQRRFVSTRRDKVDKMAQEFPPEKVRAIVAEVASLLRERKETVSVAETVCFLYLSITFL
jgi:hypothetical protein